MLRHLHHFSFVLKQNIVYICFHSLTWHEISTRAISDLHIIIKAARGFFQFEATILYVCYVRINE